MAKLEADSASDNSAKEVIKLLKGPTAVAKVVGIHRCQVHRWTLPKDRYGTGGRVPRKHWEALLDYAQSKGIDLPKRLLAPELERR